MLTSPVTFHAALGWGLVLWLLAQVMVMGGGFFSSAMGGLMAVMGSLMGHLAYGALLGAIVVAPARPRGVVSLFTECAVRP